MTEFYKGKIPIIRGDLNAGFIRGMPSEAPSFGAVPRDFSADPVEMRDSPGQMTLIPPSEDDARYDADEEAESSLEHLYLRGGKPAFEFLDQNGFPDCWCHSVAHAVMVDAMKQGLPVPQLNAVAMATLMNRTNGGWAGLAMKFARDRGCPTTRLWPYQSRKGKDTAELREDMKQHRALEDWYDLSREVWDQELGSRQIVTCLSNNLPVPSDYNPFGHSMLSMRHVRIERGYWGRLTLNSWKGFGYFGLCVIVDMWPDGSCALRSSSS